MTAPIDIFYTMPHYGQHLQSVYDALPDDRKGLIYVPSNLRPRPTGEWVRYATPSSSDGLLLVAGFQDLRYAVRRGKVLLQHGAAQVYNGVDSPSYDGGPGREQAGLFLCPNQQSADRNLARYPNAQAAVVGCPRLDVLQQIEMNEEARGVVAVAFHWNCRLVPESGWAWPTWRDAIAELSHEQPVLGHCHPRARQELLAWFGVERIEFVSTVEELLRRAEILIVDNSSVAYEWAACGRPVVFIDDATWDQNAAHGLRFGEELPGSYAGASGDIGALREALDATMAMGEQRRRVAERVYGPVDGKASQRAVDAVLAWEVDGC